MPSISIGVQILNGEKFLKKRMDSIYSQTFQDFEIIMSNNASTDNTLSMCEEYAKKDSRIRLYSQKETIVGEKHAVFVANQARCKYFVFASVDDLWEKEFLEKNFKFLEENPNYVSCSGQVERFGDVNNLKINEDDSFLKKTYKKIRKNFRPFYNLSFSGSYLEKASKCFKYNNVNFQFGLCKAEILKKCLLNYPVHSSDLIFCLKMLEFGDVKVFDEVTWKFYAGGMSSKGTIHSWKNKQITISEIFFPFYPLTKWCKNHFGWKFIFRNLRHVIWLNTIFGFTPLLLDIFRYTSKLFKK